MLCLAIVISLHVPSWFGYVMHYASAVFWMGALLFGFLLLHLARRRRGAFAHPHGVNSI